MKKKATNAKKATIKKAKKNTTANKATTSAVSDGFVGKHHSEATKQKISEALQGNTPVNKGKRGLYTHSAEIRAKISEAVKAANAKRKTTVKSPKKMKVKAKATIKKNTKKAEKAE